MRNSIKHCVAFAAALVYLLEAFHLVDAYDGSNDGRQTYIMQVAKSSKPTSYASHPDWYVSILASVKGIEITDGMHDDASLTQGPLHVYNTVLHGFSAKLTQSEADGILKVDGVLSVIPDRMLQLHTTRTPEFLGLAEANRQLPVGQRDGEGVVVGLIDTGVWPESPSFSDEGMAPHVPSRWKGTCEEGTGFGAGNCNRKLVGARAFYRGYVAAVGALNETVDIRSPLDTNGHGTHTASTAAGAEVAGAGLGGLAGGTARGMASRAHVAAYKACWAGGCASSDILAAFDTAVADGVDVISGSVGGMAVPLWQDPVAVGAFGAAERGVLVSMSAGNDGPLPGSVGNVAPWQLSVAASTLDRSFPGTLRLGNGAAFVGASSPTAVSRIPRVPLVYGAAASSNPSDEDNARLCMAGALSPTHVAGKVVMCDRGLNTRVSKGVEVKRAGGVGMILANTQANGDDLIVDDHVLPTVAVGFDDAQAIDAYIKSSSQASVHMTFQGSVLGVTPAPVVAAFSARGPNPLFPQLLKPDVTAPGVNILAAWNGHVADSGPTSFNILSGTSMSCPHASGVAALLKGAHPEWSPAAIKSALMTTAMPIDNTGHPIRDAYNSSLCTPFCYGAGHVNPTLALDPGLVYDLDTQDYINFLCALVSTKSLLLPFTKNKYQCPKTIGHEHLDLNYPSVSMVFPSGNQSTFSTTFTRTVTNVGNADSLYRSSYTLPPGIQMVVNPSVLTFTRTGQRHDYTITIKVHLKDLQNQDNFGNLLWSDGSHIVRTTLVFTWENS